MNQHCVFDGYLLTTKLVKQSFWRRSLGYLPIHFSKNFYAIKVKRQKRNAEKLRKTLLLHCGYLGQKNLTGDSQLVYWTNLFTICSDIMSVLNLHSMLVSILLQVFSFFFLQNAIKVYILLLDIFNRWKLLIHRWPYAVYTVMSTQNYWRPNCEVVNGKQNLHLC